MDKGGAKAVREYPGPTRGSAPIDGEGKECRMDWARRCLDRLRLAINARPV